jgi:hypothetical protein
MLHQHEPIVSAATGWKNAIVESAHSSRGFENRQHRPQQPALTSYPWHCSGTDEYGMLSILSFCLIFASGERWPSRGEDDARSVGCFHEAEVRSRAWRQPNQPAGEQTVDTGESECVSGCVWRPVGRFIPPSPIPSLQTPRLTIFHPLLFPCNNSSIIVVPEPAPNFPWIFDGSAAFASPLPAQSR